MPKRAPKICSRIGCGILTVNGLCPKHLAEYKQRSERQRKNSSARGYNRNWAAKRAAYLAAHPLCECDECLTLPQWARPTATDVDHIDGRGPHGDNSWDNLQALTHAHHSRKTATNDGGFGNRKEK